MPGGYRLPGADPLDIGDKSVSYAGMERRPMLKPLTTGGKNELES